MWSEFKPVILIIICKEPIEVSFFADQVKFAFTDSNSTEAKFDKDPLN